MNLFDKKSCDGSDLSAETSLTIPLITRRLCSRPTTTVMWIFFTGGHPTPTATFRHTARTTSTVLAGELHVIDIDPETGEETQRRIRKAGDYACKEPGDVHRELGGPEGALVLFNLFNPEGLLAESLASDGTVSGRSELADILKGKAYRSGIA